MKFLIAYDFSSSSKMALHYGAYLTKKLNGNISVIHVIPEIVVGPEMPMFLPDAEMITKAENELNNDVRVILDLYDLEETKINIEVSVGSVVGALLSREENTDMIIMGTHDYDNFFDKILGSTSTEFIKQCHKPVMLIHAQTTWPIHLSKSVFAVDDHTDLSSALEHYNTLNSELKAHTNFINFGLNENSVAPQFEKILKEYYLSHEVDFAFEIKHIDSNKAQDELRKIISENNIDFLCMVKQNSGFLDNYFGKSFSLSTAHKTSLPVIIYKSNSK